MKDSPIDRMGKQYDDMTNEINALVKENADLRELIETLKSIVGLKWGDSLIDRVIQLKKIEMDVLDKEQKGSKTAQ